MTKTQNPNFLYASYEHDRSGWPYKTITTDVHKGGEYRLSALLPGTHMKIDGRKSVVMARFSKNSLVRFYDNQDCLMINNNVLATPYEYLSWNDCGIPKVGEFVEVRKGEHQGRIGMVFQEGLYSTYVAFPGDRNRGLKFFARDLIIREDLQIVTV